MKDGSSKASVKKEQHRIKKAEKTKSYKKVDNRRNIGGKKTGGR